MSCDASYIDGEGEEYKLHSDFSEGDIVVLGTHNAYRMDRSALAKASTVFADMFTNGTLEGLEIHLTPENDHILEEFLRSLKNYGHHRSTCWETTIEVIDFIRPFECENHIRDLLYTASANDPQHHRVEAFALACEFNQVLAACRLLAQAWRGEDWGDGSKSLRPNSSGWTPAHAAKLSHHWLWALTCAVHWADSIVIDGTKADKAGKDYWMAVAGAFMSRVQ